MDKLTINEELVLKACKSASSKNPVTRGSLKDITKLSDRINRLIIANLRDKGYRIINNGEGYWYSRSEKQFKEWEETYTSYARTIFNRVRKMEQSVEGQVSMDGK